MWDFVIVGAGSAGCVLANRLSARSDVRVLLVEAGGPDTKREIHIPAAWPKLLKSDVDWAYFTDEQPQLHNRRLYWPRGKVLGGSSSINALIYTRGHRRDFDAWQRAGCPGWDFADVQPFFDRTRVGVHSASPGHELSRAFVEACGQAGIPRTDDFNGARQEGAGFFHVTVQNAKRSSAAAAYLQPALSRPNLTVRTGCLATRVVVDANRRATGIELQVGDRRETVGARREVILAGGAINSPQLLLLSGIGPADRLRAVGIPTVWDLPGVGQGLRDHPLAGAICECTRPISMADAGTLADIAQYLFRRKGRLCSNLAEAGAFVRTDPALDRPDLELIFAPVFYMNHGFANPPGHGFSIGAVLQHPRSAGSISLRSADPLQPPSIQPRYLSDARDLATLVVGIRLVRHVIEAPAFDPYRGRELWPGAEAQTDDEIAERVRDQLETLYHPMGTCRMGADPMAVVDEGLRVRGIDGLRVVDASVIPVTLTGHPNAVVMMCAEKAAASILEEAPAA